MKKELFSYLSAALKRHARNKPGKPGVDLKVSITNKGNNFWLEKEIQVKVNSKDFDFEFTCSLVLICLLRIGSHDWYLAKITNPMNKVNDKINNKPTRFMNIALFSEKIMKDVND